METLALLQFDLPNGWAWFFTGGVVWGIIGLLIAATKGRSGWGCCLGCLLGPFGLMPEDR